MAKRKWSFEEVEEYQRKHNQYFLYFNRDDANFRVPKANGWDRRTTGHIQFLC